MSPKSRGRRVTGTSKRREKEAPDLLFAQMVRDVGRDLVGITDPLEAELCVSQLLGIWWNLFLVDADPEVVLGEGMVAHAARKRSTGALALLRVVALLGGAAQRTKAAAAADAMAAAGVADPPWAGQLGAVEPAWARCYGDDFGDQTSVLVAFEREGHRHGLVVLVDHTLGGLAKDAFVAEDPAGMWSQIQGLAEPAMWLREISLGQARALLEPAFAVTDEMLDPPLGEDFRAVRALALARVRTLPGGPVPTPPPVEVTAEQRAEIVAEFLASPQGRRLPDAELGAECACLIVDYGCDYDSGQPLRVSPAKTEIFLLDWLPGSVLPSPALGEGMPAVVRAWASWAGRRTGLSKPALAELLDAVEEIVEELPGVLDAGEHSPAEALVGDLVGSQPDAEALQAAVERRLFAMPFFGTRIGDEDYPRLDPSDPDERGMLILGEHREYHDALDDPTFDGTVDGVNPRLHLAVHEMVAEQLWNDDPHEAWLAARRLTAAGMGRHDVLHALGEVATRHLWGALSNQEGVDVDAYRADLESLGGQPKRNRRAAQGPASAAYQLKVSLRGVKPPLWRRLLVPGSLTLPELHDVLQVAMGWTDSHPHEFATASRVFGPPDADADPDQADEAGVRLDELLHRPGDRLRYRYDFGDGWEHDVVVEEVRPAEGRVPVTCLAGRRACPPEDCGGPWGYQELCAALADPSHPLHDELADWVGGQFEPGRFDRAEVNRELAVLGDVTASAQQSL